MKISELVEFQQKDNHPKFIVCKGGAIALIVSMFKTTAQRTMVAAHVPGEEGKRVFGVEELGPTEMEGVLVERAGGKGGSNRYWGELKSEMARTYLPMAFAAQMRGRGEVGIADAGEEAEDGPMGLAEQDVEAS